MPTLLTTGTETAFHACLYKCEFAMGGNTIFSGKPCALKHSFGVNFLIHPFSRTMGTLCHQVPILAVNVGTTPFLFSLTYCLLHWYTVFSLVTKSLSFSYKGLLLYEKVSQTFFSKSVFTLAFSSIFSGNLNFLNANSDKNHTI